MSDVCYGQTQGTLRAFCWNMLELGIICCSAEGLVSESAIELFCFAFVFFDQLLSTFRCTRWRVFSGSA